MFEPLEGLDRIFLGIEFASVFVKQCVQRTDIVNEKLINSLLYDCILQ